MEEKIILLVDWSRQDELFAFLGTRMLVSALSPNLYNLTSADRHGYLIRDDQRRLALLQFDADEERSELASLNTLFWYAALAGDLISAGIVSACVIGAKDDIPLESLNDHARHAAACYPETLLGADSSRYVRLGELLFSLYATDHLTTFMTPRSGAKPEHEKLVAARSEE